MEKTHYHPIFTLTRGGITESVHFGALAVVDSHGSLVASYGDPQVVTFLRSSAKPFQALPFIQNKGNEIYHLAPREVAIICASHAGTDEHVETVKGIQAKTGVQEAELMCGMHPIKDKRTIAAMQSRGESLSPNRHNCSGKHTGMLAFTRLKRQATGLAPEDIPYIDPAHPIQKDILETFAEMCGLSPEQVVLGIDGCSAPNFAVPLYNAALGYARLCDPVQADPIRAQACRTIVSSMTSNPFMVGGPSSFDTGIMEAGGGRILSKGGAEGYQAIGILPGVLSPGSPGLGIAIKISDGDLASHTEDGFGHARPAVALEVLRQLGILNRQELKKMDPYGPVFEIENWRKIKVGQGQPEFQLVKGPGYGSGKER